MKAMKDFFKNEASYIEYTLLYMSGEQRTSILGITAKHYSNKELAKEWALGITSKISDEDAVKEVLRIYRRMVGDASAELPAKKAEAETAEPAMESPVVYMVDHGEEALKAKLEELGYDELKALVKAYHLDPNRIYSRSKKAERLREGILSRAVTRATQGDCFKNFQG